MTQIAGNITVVLRDHRRGTLIQQWEMREYSVEESEAVGFQVGKLQTGETASSKEEKT